MSWRIATSLEQRFTISKIHCESKRKLSLGISIAMIIIDRKKKKGKRINDYRRCAASARFLHEYEERSEPELLVSGSPAVLSSGRSAEPFSTGPKSGRIRRRSFSVPCPPPTSFFFCHSTTVAVSSQGFAMLTFRCGRRPSSRPSRYQLSHSCFLEGANVQFRRSANARKPIDFYTLSLCVNWSRGKCKWRLQQISDCLVAIIPCVYTGICQSIVTQHD